MSEDIRPIIEDWPYEMDNITVRRIMGADGRQKIQIRLDLGLLQLETQGRPDGQRPYSFESLLEYYQHKLCEYRDAHGSDLGFELSREDCRSLREEAMMYYHRYLACFVLEDFDAVIRDTQRNLEVFELCHRYAAQKSDRMALHRYKPYVVMMNTRAKAHLALHRRDYKQAVTHVRTGLKIIRNFYEDLEQIDEYAGSTEVKLLRQLLRSIRKQMPKDPLKQLERRLRRAVAQQHFEEAAKLKDRIERIRRRRKRKDDPDRK